LQGTVKMFSQERGFGFISGADGVEYFVHWSAILQDGFKTLEKSQEVTFDPAQEPRGPIATNVKPGELLEQAPKSFRDNIITKQEVE